MIMPEDAIEELRTFGDLVRWGATQFASANLSYGHGTDNALDESYAMLSHVLQLPHEIPPYMINSRLTKAERRKVVNFLMERIATRKPLPYLTHEAWFGGLMFYVDERVLIPRSPIAELIQHKFEPWVESQQIVRILDLCTGSACIAISCAHAFPQARICGIDISQDALDVAKINVEAHAVTRQVSLLKSDVFQALDQSADGFDVIVSNPPYVDALGMSALTEEYRHEPEFALQAGQDGLAIVDIILEQAHRFLSPQGILVVEVGNSSHALIEKYPTLPFMWPEFEQGGEGVFILTKEQLIAT